MIRTLRNFLVFMCAAFLLQAALPMAGAWAYERTLALAQDDHDEALQAIKRGEILSYSQIKRAVEDRLGGRVVDIKLRRTNRGWQYFLRVSRKDGRVVAAVVDARSGRILSTR